MIWIHIVPDDTHPFIASFRLKEEEEEGKEKEEKEVEDEEGGPLNHGPSTPRRRSSWPRCFSNLLSSSIHQFIFKLWSRRDVQSKFVPARISLYKNWTNFPSDILLKIGQIFRLMPRHIEIPEVYFLLIAMMLGQPVKTLPQTAKLDLVNCFY